MDIIYLSSSCSDAKFNELREKGITRKLPQAQKYHCLLMEGIAQNLDGSLYAISAFPVNRQWTKQVFFAREKGDYRQNSVYIRCLYQFAGFTPMDKNYSGKERY